jgi:adenylosuccinate lyase
MKAYKGDKGFRQLVNEDRDIAAHLSKDAINECFDIKYYFKNVDKIFKRVFDK